MNVLYSSYKGKFPKKLRNERLHFYLDKKDKLDRYLELLHESLQASDLEKTKRATFNYFTLLQDIKEKESFSLYYKYISKIKDIKLPFLLPRPYLTLLLQEEGSLKESQINIYQKDYLLLLINKMIQNNLYLGEEYRLIRQEIHGNPPNTIIWHYSTNEDEEKPLCGVKISDKEKSWKRVAPVCVKCRSQKEFAKMRPVDKKVFVDLTLKNGNEVQTIEDLDKSIVNSFVAKLYSYYQIPLFVSNPMNEMILANNYKKAVQYFEKEQVTYQINTANHRHE